MTDESIKAGTNAGEGADGNALVPGEGRLHIRTTLMRETLVATRLEKRLDAAGEDEVSLLPWATVINLGGSSILDRGAKALLPLLDEIVAARGRHPMILSVGGGARTRHTLRVGLDLGLPIGGLAQIVGAVEEQNAHMVHALLSSQGGVSMCREHFTELAKYLLTGMIPIVISTPPYHYWEPPPRRGDLPENGSDLGAFLTAEVLGAKLMVFVKDQNGQYDRDPRKHPTAKMFETVRVAELLKLDDNDLILERSVLEHLNRARHVRAVRVVNGLEPGALTRALAGENVGTLIQQDPR